MDFLGEEAVGFPGKVRLGSVQVLFFHSDWNPYLSEEAVGFSLNLGTLWAPDRPFCSSISGMTSSCLNVSRVSGGSTTVTKVLNPYSPCFQAGNVLSGHLMVFVSSIGKSLDSSF